ncbi:hypothetical protein O181_050125 [Austropuccinia psidii MF-1]|uniref:Helicase C-terminal domain-containing protein n=1 Tax=Austropuccinia psidii MF-1 TaxID=1389203 RepID=A0A9Q3E0H2_9BASI|nr:hypothetical protein [Austropuccinia psidii MF-1]
MEDQDLVDHEGGRTQHNSTTTQTIVDVETCMMSSKIEHLLKILLKKKNQTVAHPDLAFTHNGPSFVTFEIGIVLSHHSILSALIDGIITARGQEKALEKFFNNPECEVLIASIGAARTGLNITCTNIVYSMVRGPPEFHPDFPTLTSTFPGAQ